MKQRIKAAWMVLRGEWIAQKPGPKFRVDLQPYSNTTSYSSGTTVVWTATR